uniref:Uncharacterized protein n=1 Tax=Romanomermis culicivorax TaxID=13658 RepID=A0A915IEZ9_ROMCU
MEDLPIVRQNNMVAKEMPLHLVGKTKKRQFFDEKGSFLNKTHAINTLFTIFFGRKVEFFSLRNVPEIFGNR